MLARPIGNAATVVVTAILQHAPQAVLLLDGLQEHRIAGEAGDGFVKAGVDAVDFLAADPAPAFLLDQSFVVASQTRQGDGVDGEVRQQDAFRLQNTAKLIAGPPCLLAVQRGQEGPTLPRIADHKAFVRHLAENLAQKSAINIIEPQHLDLGDAVGQPPGDPIIDDP